jgi:hypothetical protein
MAKHLPEALLHLKDVGALVSHQCGPEGVYLRVTPRFLIA